MLTRAVIFDMDGVLLNSEPYYYKYLNSRFEKLGLHVTDEEYNGFVGLPSRKVWSYLENTRGVNLRIEELMRHEEEQVNDIFNQAQLEPVQGVTNLLESLHSINVAMSVASSSYKSTIELIIDRLGFNGYFKFLLSGTEVSNGKPHPDIFLKSAILLDVLPKDCIVIEDSTNGILGAKGAGMMCIGYKNPGSGQQDLSKADLIIDDYGNDNIQAILELLSE
jgi:HAD superfamily hydrolase (TIGR01509 family)